jgi:hypothetical protein
MIRQGAAGQWPAPEADHGCARPAQMEIDLRPELYKHHHLRAVPEKYRDRVDTRAFGTGERIVFLPYTTDVFTATQNWTEAHKIFPEPPQPPIGYDEADLVLSGALHPGPFGIKIMKRSLAPGTSGQVSGARLEVRPQVRPGRRARTRCDRRRRCARPG